MGDYLRTWGALLADRQGVVALEYGLVISVLAVAVCAAFTMFGVGLNDLFDDLVNAL